MSVDVVIAGGGPTGLMLACELRLAGAETVLVERLLQPTGLSKALALNSGAVDALDRRGLLDRFADQPPHQDLASFAHFGGIPLDLTRMNGQQLRALYMQQARVEELLEQRARVLGVEIRRGHELTGLRQTPDEARAQVESASGAYELQSQYVVGCDGGRSPVRRLAGIDFPGTEPTTLLRLGDVELPSLTEGTRLPFGVVPLGHGVFRVITREPYPVGFDWAAPMTLLELHDSARRVFGVDLALARPRWLSRFTDASRQADRYRVGRVFLAGDAAHIHLPAGGPGLSTGLQDAVNLGWKLGATIRGWAPDGLLDTYHAERHPVGRRVLMHTRAQGALLNAGEHTAALREVFGELLQYDDVLRHIVGLVQGTDTRYEFASEDAVAAHPLVGCIAPELALHMPGGASVRLAQLLHGARGVFVDTHESDSLRKRVAAWRGRVDIVEAIGITGARGGPSALLIRPDGYVAWAGSPEIFDVSRIAAGLRHALSTWFGEPGIGC